MTQHPAALHRRPGRLPRGGSPEAAAADRHRRREEYVRLRTKLAMPPADLARLLGLSVNTVRLLPAWSSASTAPTDKSLATMRRELVTRARATIEEAGIRREIERELAEEEAREHLRMCAEESGPIEDAA